MTRPVLVGLLGLIAVGCSASEGTSDSPSPKSYTQTAPSPAAAGTPVASPSGGTAPSDQIKNISGDTPPPGVK